MVDILAFGAHPDDVELGCGGTLAKEIQSGSSVVIVDLTRGELGSRGSAPLRMKEAEAAAQVLGVAQRFNLALADGFFQNDRDSQMKVIQYLRKFQPKLVLCNAKDDRHIDHPKGSNLVSDACFLSGLVKIETVDPDSGEAQLPWRPQAVYHFIQWKNSVPDFVVDISGFLDKKMEAIQCYPSQFYDPDNTGPETPISSKNFFDSVRYRAQDLGRLVGCDSAEGFTVERLLAVNHLGDLK
jgi:bacillithiol biosynthesis deacetylase BshB1